MRRQQEKKTQSEFRVVALDQMQLKVAAHDSAARPEKHIMFLYLR